MATYDLSHCVDPPPTRVLSLPRGRVQRHVLHVLLRAVDEGERKGGA